MFLFLNINSIHGIVLKTLVDLGARVGMIRCLWKNYITFIATTRGFPQRDQARKVSILRCCRVLSPIEKAFACSMGPKWTRNCLPSGWRISWGPLEEKGSASADSTAVKCEGHQQMGGCHDVAGWAALILFSGVESEPRGSGPQMANKTELWDSL